jgi:hypothetical protein
MYGDINVRMNGLRMCVAAPDKDISVSSVVDGLLCLDGSGDFTVRGQLTG